jgi:hypothetical protein
MLDRKLLLDAEQVFQEQHKLIELPSYGRGVFVGDTHGDLNATETVLGRYLHHKENTLLFLGDYVDRGSRSRENIDLLLEAKVKNPEQLYLLLGNHEGINFMGFSPCDFWDSLIKEGQGEFEAYKTQLGQLPYAASGNGLIAVHGAPPDVESIQDINSIQPGGEHWERITWGDFRGFSDDGYLGISDAGRPEFGRGYFDRVMKKLGKNVLIRSHQPGAAGIMYNNRCLTLFTSHAYLPERTVAVADLGKETASVDDLDIREV